MSVSIFFTDNSMLPTFLLYAWFALPVVVWVAILMAGRRLHPVLMGVFCVVAMVAGVFVLVGYVRSLDAQLLAEIDKYEPGSVEAERASEAWASDTGRSFLLLLSPFVTAIWYGFLFLVLWGILWVYRRMYPVESVSVNVNENVDRPTVERADDGNPYQPPVSG